MKKIILILSLSFITLLYGNEQTKKTFDIKGDTVYIGCKDTLANKGTDAQWFTLGLMIAQKNATSNLLYLMSMRVVNGVEPIEVCKWYLDFANIKDNSKYIQSPNESIDILLNIVERSVVQDNGESYEIFTNNKNKINELFKK